jgi:hypothetical protein
MTDVEKHNMMVGMIRDLMRQDRVLQMASFLTPHALADKSKVRLGSDYDGGYVMVDDFDGIDAALSFGIETNASWDGAVAARGVPVWQYDHTIAAPPEANPMFHFFPLKITPHPVEGGCTIGQALAQTGASRPASVILKIDIEGDEWDVLDACPPEVLATFSQIIIEYHAFSQAADNGWLARAIRVLGKIDANFAVAHVHANNWTGLSNVSNVYLPETLEVTYANRARFNFTASTEIFPTLIDQPNNPLLPDLYLGRFEFRRIAG